MNDEQFAKLYGTGRQILVMLQESDDGNPEIRFFTKPNGLGVCSFSVGYEDSDDGREKAAYYFDRVDEEQAWLWADRLDQAASEFAPDDEDE